MAGIAFAGKAGMSKESEMSPEQKKAVIKEFNLKKGVLVATFSGVMSACFSYGLRAGDPIKASRCNTAPPPCGRACRCWCRCCSAASPPTSSGA